MKWFCMCTKMYYMACKRSNQILMDRRQGRNLCCLLNYSEKHNDGVEEYICVIHGKLELILNGIRVTLIESGQFSLKLIFPILI